jgi:hypothetical protein
VRPAQTLLMVRPAAFGFNPETAGTNVFQHEADGVQPAQIQQRALAEFDRLAAALNEAGIEVIVVEDTGEPPKPDAVFPCNWVTFHPDGSAVLYPMHAPMRRDERRPEIIRDLERMGGFKVSRFVDLSDHEAESRFLEGSGSLVFDHYHRTIYTSLSARTDPDLARGVASLLEYAFVVFSSADQTGTTVYHTDIVLALGRRFAVVAAELIAVKADRENVIERLRSTGRELVSIDAAQVAGFAGNILEVADGRGEPVIVMSDRAYSSFHTDQIEVLERHGRIVRSDLSTIEIVGGGSARCMIADVHLPRSGRSPTSDSRAPSP